MQPVFIILRSVMINAHKTAMLRKCKVLIKSPLLVFLAIYICIKVQPCNIAIFLGRKCVDEKCMQAWHSSSRTLRFMKFLSRVWHLNSDDLLTVLCTWILRLLEPFCVDNKNIDCWRGNRIEPYQTWRGLKKNCVANSLSYRKCAHLSGMWARVLLHHQLSKTQHVRSTIKSKIVNDWVYHDVCSTSRKLEWSTLSLTWPVLSSTTKNVSKTFVRWGHSFICSFAQKRVDRRKLMKLKNNREQEDDDDILSND